MFVSVPLAPCLAEGPRGPGRRVVGGVLPYGYLPWRVGLIGASISAGILVRSGGRLQQYWPQHMLEIWHRPRVWLPQPRGSRLGPALPSTRAMEMGGAALVPWAFKAVNSSLRGLKRTVACVCERVYLLTHVAACTAVV